MKYKIGHLVKCGLIGITSDWNGSPHTDIGIIIDIFYKPYFPHKIKVFYFKTHYTSVFSTDGIIDKHTQIISR